MSEPLKHDDEIARALGVQDMVRMRVERHETEKGKGKKKEALPQPDAEFGALTTARYSGVLAGKGKDYELRFTMHVTEVTLADLVGALMNGDNPNEARGIGVSVVEGATVDVERAFADDTPDGERTQNVNVTIYTIPFAEIIHRLLHHHLNETCGHDPL